MQQELLEYYLYLLEIQCRKPGMEALCELVRAHLLGDPFENVSKPYYKKQLGLKGLPSLELFLNGNGQFHFGGTCYANNYYLYQLLTALGYQTLLCGADMSNPDVQLVGIVTIEEQEYIVDVDYATPFLTPLPRSLATDYVIEPRLHRYVLKPQDLHGYSRLELFRNGSLKHGYVVRPVPKAIRDFEPVIAASFQEEATFMNALLLARFYPDCLLVVYNLDVIEARGEISNIRALASQDELVHVIAERLGIPREITLDVLNGLGRLKDAWSH